MFDQQTNALVSGIIEWAKLESPSNRSEHVERAIGRAAADYAALGLRCERIDLGSGCARPLLVRVNQGRSSKGPSILVAGHMDTVHPVGSIDGPMPIKIKDGKLFGPGVLDMKGGNYLVLEALRGMIVDGTLPEVPITVLLNSDEEIGSPYSRALIEAEARRHDCVLIPEPVREGHAVTGRFAFARFTIVTHGKPAHAGADNRSGKSAIRAMANLIEQLESKTDMARLVSFSVGVIEGGEFVNVVPMRCSAQVLGVANTQANLDYVREVMADLQSPSPDIRLEVIPGPERPLFLPSDGTMQLLQMAKEIGGGLGLDIKGRVSGGGNDGNFTGALGIPTLDGLGVAGGGPHTQGEYLEIGTLRTRTELIARLIQRIAKGDLRSARS